MQYEAKSKNMNFTNASLDSKKRKKSKKRKQGDLSMQSSKYRESSIAKRQSSIQMMIEEEDEDIDYSAQ